MAIRDLIPFRKEKANVTVRHGQDDDVFIVMRDQMNRMFDDFFKRPFDLTPFFDEKEWMGVGDFSPQLDVSESKKEITILAELPGLSPDDIHIALDRNMLTISGEKKSESKDKGEHFYRVERSFGSFRRSIPVPDGVDGDGIEAVFKSGVLKVKLPKTAEAQKESKRIAVKSG